MEQSIFEGAFVVAKFFMSKAPSGEINCISRTLGKFSIIDKGFTGKVEDKDIWLCKIIKEIKPGKNAGAFVLHPIKKISDPKTEVKKLIPGFYDVLQFGKTAVVKPNNDPESFWMLSIGTRKIFSQKYYAVIVPIQYEESVNHDSAA